MFSRALALYRRHFMPLLLTAALALVPANLVMAGAVRFGLAAIGVTGGPKDPPPQDDLKSADVPGGDKSDRAKLLRKESTEGRTAFGDMLRPVLPLLYAAVVVVALL